MQQDKKFKIKNIEKYRDNLKYDAFFYAKISALVATNIGVMEFMSSNIPDKHLKSILFLITTFAGVTFFNVTLLKSIKSYIDYLKLNNLILNNECNDKTKDLLIKLHLEDTDEVEKERNLC